MPFNGTGSNVTSLNASNISSGTVPTARLATGTANNTTFLRGDSTWQTVAGGFSGATSNAASGNDLTLTASSTQTQVVIPQDITKAIILPNATTMPTLGTPVFVLVNRGGQISLKNSTGTIIGVLPANQIINVTLVNNSTAAGDWAFSPVSQQAAVVAETLTSTITYTNPAIGSNINFKKGQTSGSVPAGSFCWLSDSTFVVVYTYGTQTARGYAAIVGTVSGSSITYGPANFFPINTSTSSPNGGGIYGSSWWQSQYFEVIRMSDTTFLINLASNAMFMYVNSGQYGIGTNFHYDYVIGGTVSGSSVSFTSISTTNGSQGSTSTRYPSRPMITRLSNTTAFMVWNPSGTGNFNSPYSGTPQAAILTFSGGSLSLSGQTGFGSTNEASYAANEFTTYKNINLNPVVAPNVVLIRGTQLTNGAARTWLATISGTSISSIQQATVVGDSSGIIIPWATYYPLVTSADGSVFFADTNSVRPLTVSGTTVTLGASVSTAMTGGGGSDTDMVYFSPSNNNNLIANSTFYRRFATNQYVNLGASAFYIQAGQSGANNMILNPSNTRVVSNLGNATFCVFANIPGF